MLRFFERLVEPFPAAHPTQPPHGLFAFCRHYTRGVEWPLIAMSLLTATMAILEVILVNFMGSLVDWLMTQEAATLWQDQGGRLLAMTALLLIVMPILVFFHTTLVHQTLLGNYPMRIRWQAHRHLLRQSLPFFQHEFAGRLATKVMQTALGVRETVMKLLDVMVYIAVYFGAVLMVIAFADKILMLPFILWLVLYITIQRYFVPKLKHIASAQADARSSMTGRIVDSYSNIQTVKLFAHSQREAQYAQESMQRFMTTVHQQMRLATGLNVCVNVLNYSLTFTVAALGIWLWQTGTVSIGVIAVAISLSLRISNMAQWIMWEISALFENMGTVSDGMNTLAQPLAVIDDEHATPLTVTKGAIDFQHLHFAYPGSNGSNNAENNDASSKTVLHDLNLQIRGGEKVGIVGRSGAGKSTLVNVLLRFFEPQQGRILIDGQDIRQHDQDSVRAVIGMVTQDTALLHRSVRDNILYGRPDATEAELLHALQQAEADQFIHDLSDLDGHQGLDAQVGERGVKLSGGQRQRIAIARVLLKDAPILILDEATSALDSEVEAAIQHNLNTLMANKTVIAIAHRLSTLAAMDRIIVLDQGNIVEQGSHQQLLALGGIYAQLWAHQSGGFIGDS